MENLGYYNGNIGAIEDINIPMLDRGVYFGDGIYEVVITVNHKIFALNDHIERLYKSAEMLKIIIPYTKEELKDILYDLVKKVDADEQLVYFQVTRVTAQRSHKYNKDIKGNLYITITPFNDIGNYKKRVKLITVPDTRAFHCNIKTLNLIPNVMASQKASECGCEEAIFHRGNIVTEASYSNVYIIKNGVLKTHPTNRLILAGITRKNILNICNSNNMNIEEIPFTIKDMMEADEVMLSSTTKFIVAAKEINGVPVGGRAPAVIKLLQYEYMNKILNETMD